MIKNIDVAVFQLKKMLQDIRGYKGEWKKSDIFNKYVSDMNKWAKDLGLVEFKFEDFHYSYTGKTINENGYESLMNHIAILESMLPSISTTGQNTQSSSKSQGNDSKKVFVVHGRDRTALLETESLLRRIGLEPVVLHRMANNGMTLIEKFEKCSDVKYAVVLLTPDDIGALNEDYPNYRFRARQNVIFELGFFYGKLGRSKVCCIYKSNVELPSDINGVAYLPYNQSVEEIEMALLKELKAANLQFQAF
ncbi:TIR domain-containing protein [Brevibacillus sp. HB1.2]|uniref:TIR domain-containing protein n=1 Tax=Brevibacillus sp. HB1.2 TaxID=2738807 RepID=UPI0020C65516|nr:nucleotide-binding protein [Brevibacillus sp. HB1.2]